MSLLQDGVIARRIGLPSGAGLPSSGYDKWYVSTVDGKLHYIDSAGVDVTVNPTTAESAWQNAGLAANWANTGAPFATTQYRSSGTRAYIMGVLTRSTSTYVGGGTIFTLAAGFRPLTLQPIQMAINNGTGDFGAMGYVDTAGILQCTTNVVATGTLKIMGMIHLDK